MQQYLNKVIHSDNKDILVKLEPKSVDLILIDPPYLISRPSNFQNHNKMTKYQNLKIDFGEWDKKEADWEFYLKEFYRILKDGGTLIMFYDIYKLNDITDTITSFKIPFKQPRVMVWVKNNPVPVNSKVNYLTNAKEFMVSYTKGKNPTFHSSYDNGIYNVSTISGKEVLKHPTQKPNALMKALIEKHSNTGDIVLDAFAGSGTTCQMAKDTGRNYIGIEMTEEYIEMCKKRGLNVI